MEKEEKVLKRLRDIIIDSPVFRGNVYLVGGAVRDKVLGLPPKDIDLCIDVEDGVNKLVTWLQTSYPGEFFGFCVYPKYGTAAFCTKVDSAIVTIECVIPRSETYGKDSRNPTSIQQTTIAQDALRRDFCCNALYMDLTSDMILDPTGRGHRDCLDRVLNTPLPAKETYEDDPLRMLRTIRFMCTKGFTIGECGKELKLIDKFLTLSNERIIGEVSKILMSPRAVEGITYLHTVGLLPRISKELSDMFGFDQKSKYHDLDLSGHTLKVLQTVINNNPKASLELRLAALLHDVAKPVCNQLKTDGDLSYIGHEIESAKLAREILTTLRVPNNIVDKVEFLISQHMRIKQLYDRKTKRFVGKDKLIRKLVHTWGDNLKEVLELIEADNVSHKECYNLTGQVASFYGRLNELGSSAELNQVTSPVKGGDIIDYLALSLEDTKKYGKAIGKILGLIQEVLYENPESTTAQVIKEVIDQNWEMCKREIENT